MASPALSPSAAVARRDDPDRYLTALFAPPADREDVFTLIAANAEIARTRERVSEPMLGRIRLQWWREALDGIEAGTPRRHEVVTPLAELMARRGLPRAPLDRLIDAREADFEDGRFATMEELVTYARETAVPLADLILTVTGESDPAVRARAGEVAIGYALTGLLRSTAFLAREKRLVIPEQIALRHGLRVGDLFEFRDHDGLRAAVAEIAAAAEARLAKGRLSRAARPVLLQAVLARRQLSVLRRLGYDALSPEAAVASPARVWRLWWACLAGRG